MESLRRTVSAESKRDAILSNALAVFAKEGLRNTDVQIIADLARVGKGTVYRNFGNKEELFLATARYCNDQLNEYFRTTVGDEPQVEQIIAQHGTAEFLRRVAVAYAGFYQKHPQAVEMMIQERAEFGETVFPTHLMYRAERRAGCDEIVQAAIARGEFRAIDAKAITNTFADMLFGCVVNGVLEGGKATLVERVTHAADLFLGGLVLDANKNAEHSR